MLYTPWRDEQADLYHEKNTYVYILQNCTPIFAQKRTFLIKDVWVTWVQFPLHCAAACTIHVAQSATFHDIYIDVMYAQVWGRPRATKHTKNASYQGGRAAN